MRILIKFLRETWEAMQSIQKLFIGHRLRHPIRLPLLFFYFSYFYLLKPFVSKPFSVYMWIQSLTIIYTHHCLKSPFNSTIFQYYCQQV